jgi:hypothetical protein
MRSLWRFLSDEEVKETAAVLMLAAILVLGALVFALSVLGSVSDGYVQ